MSVHLGIDGVTFSDIEDAEGVAERISDGSMLHLIWLWLTAPVIEQDEVGLRASRISGKTYPHVEPSKASVQAVKRRITGMTSRSRTMVDMGALIKEVNHTVRGWVGYFHYRNCSHRLCHVRTHLEERMRTHLRKRHKIRDRNSGYMRFSRRELYQALRTVQSAGNSGLDKGACLEVKSIGKPCAGKSHARFDEGGLIGYWCLHFKVVACEEML